MHSIVELDREQLHLTAVDTPIPANVPAVSCNGAQVYALTRQPEFTQIPGPLGGIVSEVQRLVDANASARMEQGHIGGMMRLLMGLPSSRLGDHLVLVSCGAFCTMFSWSTLWGWVPRLAAAVDLRGSMPRRPST